MRATVAGFLVALLACMTPVTAAPPAIGVRAVDSDHDGLSDFDEVHKYRTHPNKADSDGDGTPDGDWNERREYTYSIRCLISHMLPAEAVTDGWQDAREIHRAKDFVELEIIAYPLATPAKRTKADDQPPTLPKELVPYREPNITNDFDNAMSTEVLIALKLDGIDAGKLASRALVEKVSKWAMRRVDSGDTGFTIYYVTEEDGKLVVEDGLEEVARKARSDPKRSLEDQLDIEVRGASMFRKKRCGSCTSTGVYLQTILRALGIPTRATVAMPPVDAGDKAQLKMLREGLRPSALRDEILKGASSGAGGWVEHTFNDVWVGGRWMRLNYSKLGQPLADRNYCGLMLRILTYDDLVKTGASATWGRRYGLRERSARYPNGNGYRLLSVSDRMGTHARVTLPPARKAEHEPSQSHKALTIVAARWSRHEQGGTRFIELECKEWFDDQDGDQYKRFTNKVDRTFYLRAKGHPDVEVHCGVGSVTGDDYHAVAVWVPKPALKQIVPNVPYVLVAQNANDELKWSVNDGVTIELQ